MSPAANPLVVAIDTPTLAAAEDLVRRLDGTAGMLKIGLELFCGEGPSVVTRLREEAPVFLDLKLHDIPHTVRGAARQAGRLGASLLTVHALGGPDMVAAAVRGAEEGAAERGVDPPAVIGVTILSSLAEAAGASPVSLAFEAVSAGARGAVVSGDDVEDVRAALGDDPILVVPGIRPSGHASDGHVRVLTPAEALEAGADHIVVGRPITESSDPAAAARAILREAGIE